MKPIRVALIPASAPDEILPALVRELALHDFFLIVVNDGCDAAQDPLFDEVSLHAVVLRHPEALGRCAALDTGLTYLREHFPFHYTAVILDCDGRHRICDAEHLCRTAEEHRDALVWGTRILPRKTPPGERIRGKIRSLCTHLATGISVRDPDSGMCAFSDQLTGLLLDSPHDDSFVRRILRCCKRAHRPVAQVRIRNQNTDI